MQLKKLLEILNKKVPFHTAESWDNVGLLIGNKESEVTGILTALDCTGEIVDEAIEKNINTIITHHPLIFKGIKQIIDDDAYGSIIYRLIQNNINLIALHTNLDVHPEGVNAMLAEKIGLKDFELLNKEKEHYYKIQIYIPEENAEAFKDTLSQHGLAQEGEYAYCFFNTIGKGQFKPLENANPHIGEIGRVETVQEQKIEFMIQSHQRSLAEALIHQYHPYETPVYDVIQMTRTSHRGLGMIGNLEHKMTVNSFVNQVKNTLQMPSVRFIGDMNASIQRIAIIGGSGMGYEVQAQQSGADLFITGDIKHHDALDAKIAGINLLDINHYSEYVMKEGLVHLLRNWLEPELEHSFKIEASARNTDPYDYL
ncbi:Nif3-like dinuclear metal center hexameric protein [Staphylococcus coagulans]|uniref:Nif3-like dinuclear metal center hexameric protein n=1 Tax=Staphylococcus coagulans TaxID=74706 RepID=UPI000679FC5E|nr:Nif3-like dinuclear metal center hexameric protein [Staphylococcus coagulans]AKS67012.1 hypothetical protein LH95_05955 [Staphylococcus schleiferi]MBA8773375.1 Nif3-like dinuclear metal center hexameric protein [Staphylococcus coagulans]